MTEMADEIARMRKLSVPELVVRYRGVFGKDPRVKNREWLWKRISWELQARKYGGLSAVAKKRLEELMAEIELPLSEKQRTVSGTLKKPPKPNDPPVGTTLIRVWRDKELRVQVVDGGFEHEGIVYKTLSETAKAITGSHWNGKLFFGLTSRKRKTP